MLWALAGPPVANALLHGFYALDVHESSGVRTPAPADSGARSTHGVPVHFVEVTKKILLLGRRRRGRFAVHGGGLPVPEVRMAAMRCMTSAGQPPTIPCCLSHLT